MLTTLWNCIRWYTMVLVINSFATIFYVLMLVEIVLFVEKKEWDDEFKTAVLIRELSKSLVQCDGFSPSDDYAKALSSTAKKAKILGEMGFEGLYDIASDLK